MHVNSETQGAVTDVKMIPPVLHRARKKNELVPVRTM